MKLLGKKSDQKGVAMMMTLVTMLLLSILAAELVYQNQIYSGLVFRSRDQLRARLLARSALRIALLQVRAAGKAKAQLKTLSLSEDLANKIWQTPLILPPPTPPGLGLIESQNLSAFSKSLGLDGTMTVMITAEGDRLDINQLIRGPASAAAPPVKGVSGGTGGPGGTPSPEQKKQARDNLKNAYIQVLDQVLEKKRQDDDKFREKYSVLRAEPLITNLLAFMDPETKQDADNREKNEYYTTATPTPYSLKDGPLVSESEFFMVKGFDEVIAGIMADHFTTQSSAGLDVNRISASLLQALIPEFNNDDMEKFMKRRDDETQGGNFKTADEFWTYLKSLGSNYDAAQKRLTDAGITILGDKTTYRVSVTGESGMAHKNWQAVIGGVAPLSDADKAQPGQPQPNPQTPNPPPTTGAAPAAKSTVDPLQIIYLKSD